ncbi:Replicase RepFR55 [Bacillus sp. Xin]|uniref:Replicase RepFR55 n=1 Tax=unclassified Bacillus (in: firmicutes) TaxID=185979 RepID=UPI0015725BAF|nr:MULTISPECIES: Replicase RepFR55 [unclassified Bacillus (in: firmicutes)]MBC6971856.1 Replicase RepFR55 [Bacillus sp. Xin]NSW39319.1 Replicase RepFR55 [Bacillus sp. Xin1]
MLLQNFLLSRAKAELSPRIKHLSKTPGAINQAIKKVTTYIDNIVLECEGVTTNGYLTPRKFEALETVLSYLVQEGYSQVKQDHISKKAGISKPIINYVFNWLQDLGVCQQIKVRRHGKIAPSIYILTLHNNYLKIIEYFKMKWAVAIDVCSTFTKFLERKLFKKSVVSKHEEKNISSNGIDILNFEEVEKPNTNLQNTTDRSQNLNDYLSEDQKKAYHYITSQRVTYLTEQDAYTIALRMPKKIDRYQRWDFEKCVEWFEYNQAEISNPSHFIKMFAEKSKQRKDRNANVECEEKYRTKFNFYNWIDDPKFDLILQKLNTNQY